MLLLVLLASAGSWLVKACAAASFGSLQLLQLAACCSEMLGFLGLDFGFGFAVCIRGVEKKISHTGVLSMLLPTHPPTRFFCFFLQKAPSKHQADAAMHSAPQHAMLVMPRQLDVRLLCKLSVLLCMLCLLPHGGGKGRGRLPGAEEKKGNPGRNKGDRTDKGNSLQSDSVNTPRRLYICTSLILTYICF